MPTFPQLTKHVMDFFDPPEESLLASLFRPWNEEIQNKEESDTPKYPLDQIFHMLYQEYGRDDVNALVADRLLIEDSSDQVSTQHNVIARISSDLDANPQIVTTNFDHLFEPTLKGKVGKVHEPPAFPDISLGVPLTGITYLHGRLKEPEAKQHPYVLSSADFGRAYLSEGWATSFIRSLLEHFTVVLVGYKAEDPPVNYLLQGLNHDEKSGRSNLYAFDRGLPAEIEAKWRDRGVTAIAYKDHHKLWESLKAWADRADDPRKWRANVIKLAMKGPRQIASHERGQVFHLVRSTPGARLLATAPSTPPAEWLCVFDAYCRAAKKSSGYGNTETFDPLDEFGLDDDPPRLPESSDLQIRRTYENLLEWHRGDTNPPTSHQLSNRQPTGSEDLPPRLSHLLNWIAINIESPVIAWWAIRQFGLHPQLVDRINHQLRRIELPQEARRIWNLILEYQSDDRNFNWGDGWFELKDRVKNEGWNPSVLRSFESKTAPFLSCHLPSGNEASMPPFKDWDDVSPKELARWEVKFPDRHEERIDIPDKVLLPVFNIAQANLYRAVGFLKDLNETYYITPTCYPDREVDGQDDYRTNVAVYFEWFLKLFNRMVDVSPEITRAHVLTWPTDDQYFFRKLKLYALNRVELFKANEAAEILLELNQDCFWDEKIRRELVFLLSDRWDEFSSTNRNTLTVRLLNGPDKMDHWSEDDYPNYRIEIACRYARWLSLQGRSLSPDHTRQLDSMISGIPEWNDGWATGYVTEHRTRAEWVRTDETPDAIIDLPVNEIVERAEADQDRYFERFTEKRPFTGLVKVNPRIALGKV
ncbi:hypothetical protein BOW50_11080 [Solemya velum gill symbiont]|nr:hypothetical protein BOW50_11080 [Solemya velum gill symbiont]